MKTSILSKASILLIIVLTIGCSMPQSKQTAETQTTSTENNEAIMPPTPVESIEEAPPILSDQTIEVEETEKYIEEAAPIEDEEKVIEESVVVHRPPEPQVSFVESDLRKEFPKKDHIRIAKRLNVDIEEIYYYNNRSIVLAIYVNTKSKLNEKELKLLQKRIYRVLWDFRGANIITFVKAENQFYAIISSEMEWGTLHSVVYDYNEVQKEFSNQFNKIAKKDNFPFKKEDIFGVYIRSGFLDSKEKSDYSKISLKVIVKNEDETYSEYFAHRNKIFTKNPTILTLEQGVLFRERGSTDVRKICPYGDLLRRDTDSNFNEKHNDFLFKIHYQ